MSGKVIKEGFMVKSPPLHKVLSKWKRRYFRLFESGRLDYYVHEHDAFQDVKGIINLLDCETLELLESFPGRSHCMKLTTPQRVFILQCSSNSDLRVWCQKIASTRDNAIGASGVSEEEGIASAAAGTGKDGPLDTSPSSPAVATVGKASSGTAACYINFQRDSPSHLTVEATPPRPMKSYSPQPPSRNSYTPGEHGGNKVTRQKTFAGMSTATNQRPGESNLDGGTRKGRSFDDMMVPSVSHRVSPSVTPKGDHPFSQSYSHQSCPSMDAAGYVPMVRPEEVQVEDEYERMDVQTPPTASRKQGRSNAKPSSRSNGLPATPSSQLFEVPEEYEKWQTPSPIVSRSTKPSASKPPYRPTKQGTREHSASIRPQAAPRNAAPRITPRGQSVR